MKTIRSHTLSLLVALFMLLPGLLYAADVPPMLPTGTASSSGKTFWVTFMRLQSYTSTASNLQLKIYFATTAKTSVTVTNPATGWTLTKNAGGAGSYDMDIPAIQAYNFNSDEISPSGLIVTASANITLFAYCSAFPYVETTNVLPVEALSTDYILQGYDRSNILSELFTDCTTQFAIVGTEDHTTVKMWLRDRVNGKPEPGQFIITLNRGQVYYASTTDAHSITGSMIAADKPIAVFNGNYNTQIPVLINDANMVWEQAIPVHSWGKQFVLTKSYAQNSLNRATPQTYNRIEITAAENNTVITIAGERRATLQAGESYIYDLYQDAVYMETSKPVACYLYLTGHAANLTTIGNPAMVWISPLEQRVPNITYPYCKVMAGTRTYSPNYFVNIVVPKSAIADMKFGTSSLSSLTSELKPVPGNDDWYYCIRSMSKGRNGLSNTTGGFVAHTYAIGTVNEPDYAYAHNVGSYFGAINTVNIADDIAAVAKDITYDTCGTGSVTLYGKTYTASGVYMDTVRSLDTMVCRLHINFNPTYHIVEHAVIRGNDKLYWEGLTIQHGGTYEKRYQTAQGCDSVRIVSVQHQAEGSIDTYDTICYRDTYTFINTEKAPFIHTFSLEKLKGLTSPTDYVLEVRDHVECLMFRRILRVNPERQEYNVTAWMQHGTPYRFGDRILYRPGHYDHTFTNYLGCDSVVHLTLTHHGAAETHLQEQLCMGDELHWRGQTIIQPGTYTDTIDAFDGCDSILILTVTPKKGLSKTVYATIVPGETYIDAHFNVSVPGHYEKTIPSTTGGCDTIYILELSVCSPVDTTVYDTVVYGTMLDLDGWIEMTVSGIYPVTLTKTDGCDSIVNHHVTVLEEKIYRLTVTANDPSLGQALGSDNAVHGGDIRTIAAIPLDDCVSFLQWSDGSGTNPRQVTVTQDSTFTAVFEKKTYTITTQTENINQGEATARVIK